jgi:GT2 family glycosyltransferase
VQLRTRYQHYEILIATTATQSAQVNDWLGTYQHPKVQVLRAEQSLSVPALLNAASRQAQGEYLVLLAADAEVVNPNWLDSLLNHAQRPEVGVVGPKLVDRDGKVSQAGLILGMHGGWGRRSSVKHDADGYLYRLSVEQNCSAVSNVCLMVRKELFEALGGLDDSTFGDAFNDVDLCLKAAQAGYLTVWTPRCRSCIKARLPRHPRHWPRYRKMGRRVRSGSGVQRQPELSGKGYGLNDSTSLDWSQLLA